MKDVKINIAVLAMKDGTLSIKHGMALPLTLSPNIDSDGLLRKAVEKHSHFNNNAISGSESSYRLLYQDESEVKTLPGSDKKFTLQRYKEEIHMSYSGITSYLCSSHNFFDHLTSAMNADHNEYELDSPIFEIVNGS